MLFRSWNSVRLRQIADAIPLPWIPVCKIPSRIPSIADTAAIHSQHPSPIRQFSFEQIESVPLFAEALQNESKISYLVDMLLFGTDEEILDFSGTEGRR